MDLCNYAEGAVRLYGILYQKAQGICYLLGPYSVLRLEHPLQIVDLIFESYSVERVVIYMGGSGRSGGELPLYLCRSVLDVNHSRSVSFRLE